MAVGAAGLLALDDWRGRRDAHGRELRATAIAVADAVAGAADLVRIKDGDRPAVLVRGLARFVSEEDGPGAVALRVGSRTTSSAEAPTGFSGRTSRR